MRRFLLLAVSACLIALPQPSFAWGIVGHKVVGYIAEAHLTPAASASVKRLLAMENKESLADVANWADEIRPAEGGDGPMHSVRLPLDHEEQFDLSEDCPQKRCIVYQIALEKRVLRSRKTSDSAKLMALKYLVHFVGDIHQPLHTSEDTGLWPVVFKGEPSTLHKVWDSEIVNAQRKKAVDLAREIDATVAVKMKQNQKPSSWAFEGRNIARDQILSRDVMRKKQRNSLILDEDYISRNYPIVEVRLKLAGLRLAETLNNLFP